MGSSARTRPSCSSSTSSGCAEPPEAVRAPPGASGSLAPRARTTVLPRPQGHPRRAAARIGPVGGAPRPFARVAATYGYGLIQSPMFEDLGVFQRVGEGTDVVRKEMYDFEDKGGRRIALRPEGTASVVRAFVQHRPTTPWKVWYAAPAFRYERPQAGRYRQHHQVGVEALGVGRPRPRRRGHRPRLRRSAGARPAAGRACSLNSMGDARRPAALRRRAPRWLPRRAPRPRARGPPRRSTATRCGSSTPSARPRRAVIADAPRIADLLCDAAPRPTSSGSRTGSARSASPFALDPASCAASTTTRAPRSSSRATRSTRPEHASAAAAATTGWSRSWAARRRRASASAPASSGVLLACDAEGVFPAPAARVDVFVVDAAGGDRAPRPHRRAARGPGSAPTGPSTAGR